MRKFYKENSRGPAKYEVAENIGLTKYSEDVE
jgi:hypothetical protein